MIKIIVWLLIFAAVSFIQNMAFTFTSRSRNSGDPDYHRYAAWGSNGIWLLNQIFLFDMVFKPLLENGVSFQTLVYGIVYIICTTEGSVLMMKIMLGYFPKNRIARFFTEKKSQKVGSNKKK